jgi:hypothetical protein
MSADDQTGNLAFDNGPSLDSCFSDAAKNQQISWEEGV